MSCVGNRYILIYISHFHALSIREQVDGIRMYENINIHIHMNTGNTFFDSIKCSCSVTNQRSRKRLDYHLVWLKNDDGGLAKRPWLYGFVLFFFSLVREHIDVIFRCLGIDVGVCALSDDAFSPKIWIALRNIERRWIFYLSAKTHSHDMECFMQKKKNHHRYIWNVTHALQFDRCQRLPSFMHRIPSINEIMHSFSYKCHLPRRLLHKIWISKPSRSCIAIYYFLAHSIYVSCDSRLSF